MAEAKRKRALSEPARSGSGRDALELPTGTSSLRRKLGMEKAGEVPSIDELIEEAFNEELPEEPEIKEPEKDEGPAEDPVEEASAPEEANAETKDEPIKRIAKRRRGRKEKKPALPDNVTDIRDVRRAHNIEIKKKKKTFVLNKAPRPEDEAEPPKRRTAAFILLALLLIAAGALVALYFAAQTEIITVEGNERFSETEIINLSGLYTGRNLYLYDLGEAKRAIERDPYIECRAIRRVFPHELHIEIAERHELLAIASSGGIYTVTDAQGFVLDVGKRADITGLIPVYGFGSMGFTTGTSIISDRTKLRPWTLMQIVSAVGERAERIASIDLSNSASIKIVTKEGAAVMLGDSVMIPEKIEYMFNALRKADAASLPGAVIYINSNGTADLAYPTPEATVAPDETDAPEETDEPDETGDPADTQAPGETAEPDDTEVSDEP